MHILNPQQERDFQTVIQLLFCQISFTCGDGSKTRAILSELQREAQTGVGSEALGVLLTHPELIS